MQIANSYIDADSHIEDNDDIWNYLPDRERHRRPSLLDVGSRIVGMEDRNYVWLIDGEIYPKLTGFKATCYGTPTLTEFARKKPISTGAQDLTSLADRLAVMDRSGVDKSILFSTLFLQPIGRDSMFEAALMRAYSDYMAATLPQAGGRLLWAAPLPMREPSSAVEELRRARELGAIGAMVLGTAGNVLLHDPRNDIVWREAEKLGFPICIHVGWAHQALHETCESQATSLMLTFESSMVMAFYSLLSGGILDRFPGLRVVLVEGALGWYSVALKRMSQWSKTPTAMPWPTSRPPKRVLEESCLYFTCEGDEEDLVDFIGLVGPDRVMGSADFPHVHFEEGRLKDTFAGLQERPDLDSEVRSKLMSENASKFFSV